MRVGSITRSAAQTSTRLPALIISELQAAVLVFPGRPRKTIQHAVEKQAPCSLTLAAQCEASSLSVLYGAARVIERGSLFYRTVFSLHRALARFLRAVTIRPPPQSPKRTTTSHSHSFHNTHFTPYVLGKEFERSIVGEPNRPSRVF